MDTATALTDDQALVSLGSALAIGLLFRLERGWHGLQAEDEGQRVAGMRAFGPIGLLGGASGLTAQIIHPSGYGFAFLGIAAILTTAYMVNHHGAEDAGITSLFAALSSSTALTLHLARVATRKATGVNLLSPGVLIANGTLFPRILVIAADDERFTVSLT